ncbi:MAG: hypothetical protein LBD73_05440, partial [Deferribacteraceae bacterium]|nr:hypothetical protein [Deferribacteraceae bacterium]
LHPAFIHFPIAFFPLTLLSQILFFITGRDFFFNIAFFVQILSLITALLAFGTGIVSWMINYSQSFDACFRVKISCAILCIILTAIAVVITVPIAALQELKPLTKGDVALTVSTGITFINCVLMAILSRYGRRLTWI